MDLIAPSALDKPLDEADLKSLSKGLKTAPGAMSIEMLDGFFAALACSPEFVLPGVFIPLVWGADHEFATVEQAEKYTRLILRHFNSIAACLIAGRSYYPVLHTGRSVFPIGEQWSLGFLRGVGIGGEAWGELFHDGQYDGIVGPILALAGGSESGIEIRGQVGDDRRLTLLTTISHLLAALYGHFAAYRRRSARSKAMPQAVIQNAS